MLKSSNMIVARMMSTVITVARLDSRFSFCNASERGRVRRWGVTCGGTAGGAIYVCCSESGDRSTPGPWGLSAPLRLDGAAPLSTLFGDEVGRCGIVRPPLVAGRAGICPYDGTGVCPGVIVAVP